MMGIKVKTLIVIAVFVCCVESREKLGKLKKRQVGAFPHANVVGSFAKDQQTGQHRFVQAQPQYQNQQNQAQYQNQQNQPQYRPNPQVQAQPQQFNNFPSNAGSASRPLSTFGSANRVNNYRPQPQVATPFSDIVIQNALSHISSHAQILRAVDGSGRSLISKLASNATRIRPNIVEGFSCAGRDYGYYADIANDCQIYHVCYPLRKVFKTDLVPDVTFHFSFICNEFTRFSQDSMTCAWEYEAVECGLSEQLYFRNQEFFKTTTPKPSTPGFPRQVVGNHNAGNSFTG